MFSHAQLKIATNINNLEEKHSLNLHRPPRLNTRCVLHIFLVTIQANELERSELTSSNSWFAN